MQRAEVRKRRLARHGEEVTYQRPCMYAYNERWGGVCLVIGQNESPFVVTVTSRAEQRARERRYKQVEEIERRHQRLAKQGRRERKINKAS